MNDNTNYTEETMDQLLDETLDDLADAPETKLWPNGAHAASVKINRGKKTGSYIINCKYQQCVELTNPADEEPSEGDQTAVFIHTRKKDGTANELGQGQLKKILLPLSEALNTVNINEILEATKDGIDVILVTKIRKSRDEKYDDSQEIVKLELQG